MITNTQKEINKQKFAFILIHLQRDLQSLINNNALA